MPEPTNTVIAAALDVLGDLSELDGAAVYRVVAYRNAAKAVRESPDALRAAAEEQRVRKLKGFGPNAEEAILASLRLTGAGEAQPRVVLDKALAIAEPLIAALSEHPSAQHVELAGSARRMADTV